MQVSSTRDERHKAHVVVTGRGAPPGLIDAAGTVTEMALLKHALKAGVKAQKGVEF